MIVLKPKNTKIEPIEVDHVGWVYLEKLLDKLGLSTKNMDFVNSGKEIKVATTRRWGDAILCAVDNDEICDLKVKDATAGGGFRLDPMVKNTASSYYEYEDISDGDKDWLKFMANFFLESLGLRQE